MHPIAVKKLSLAMPISLVKELEKEKGRRIPRVTMTTLIVEAVAEKYGMLEKNAS
mgnify:CR=1 FL=1